MLDGIYQVTFSSNSNDFGDGIAVLKGNSVNGGDHGYIYTGTKEANSGTFKAVLKISQWNSSVPSVFGPIKEFVLELEGNDESPNGFIANGYMTEQPGRKISIRGRYISSAS